MSNRSLIEFNHDYAPRPENLAQWATDIFHYLCSGDPKLLPQGLTLIDTRHHSEPEWKKRG